MLSGHGRRCSWHSVRLLAIAALVLATVAGVEPALGQEPGRATLTVLRGTVSVIRSNGASVQPARSGLVMDPGDRVSTVGRAGALITFFVGIEIEMGADTTLTLKELSRGPGERINITIETVLGSAVHRVATLADTGSSYRIEAAGTVAVIRGTVIGFRHDEAGNVTVALLEAGGDVFFPNDHTRVYPGQSVTATARGDVITEQIGAQDVWSALSEGDRADGLTGLDNPGASTGSDRIPEQSHGLTLGAERRDREEDKNPGNFVQPAAPVVVAPGLTTAGATTATTTTTTTSAAGGGTVGSTPGTPGTTTTPALPTGATLVVNSTADNNARDGVLTLREAMLIATGQLSYNDLTPQEKAQISLGTGGAGVADTILFDPTVFAALPDPFLADGVPGNDPLQTDRLVLLRAPAALTTLNLTGPLPPLTGGFDVLDGKGVVVLQGPGAGFPGDSHDAITLQSDGNVVRGFQLHGFENAITVNGAGNTIGGTTAAARNVIGRNVQGIVVNVGENKIQGNYLGTDAAGTTGDFNFLNSIHITDARLNLIGGTDGVTPGGACTGACNVIATSSNGILIEGVASTGQVIQGNYIGTDRTGATGLPNNVGLMATGGGSSAIGGTTPEARNIISGNGTGVWIETNNNTVQGNYIGPAPSGTAAVATSGGGMVILGNASNNLIGGTTPETCNVISGGSGAGIAIQGPATSNTVQGNYVGTDRTGTVALGNGVLNGPGGIDMGVNSATGNTIGGANATPGGACTGACNLISGNEGYALFSTASNTIQGNYIGTDVTGASAVPNNHFTSAVFVANTATLGGTTPATRNVVAGNAKDGINTQGAGWKIQGNYIGVSAQGFILGNGSGGGGVGIRVKANSSDGLIGGPNAGEGNTISGNNGQGIVFQNDPNPSPPVKVLGNIIGLDPSGTFPKANTAGGILVMAGSTGNVIGAPAVPLCCGITTLGNHNLITGNSGNGLTLQAVTTVQGNRIGIDIFGNPFGNSGQGILISGDGSTIGGPNVNDANEIAYNTQNGISVSCTPLPTCNNNTIRGNSIFQNTLAGIAITANPNVQHGVDTPTLGAVSDAANSVTVTDADCPASPPLCVVEAYDNDITPVPAGDNQDEARTSLGTNTMTGPGPTVVVVPGNIVQNHPITVTVTLPTGDTSAISGKVVAGP